MSADADCDEAISQAFVNFLLNGKTDPKDRDEREYIVKHLVPCLVPGM